MNAPFMQVIRGFAEARERDQARYRCPDCGSVTRTDASDTRETIACWANDMGIICTGRAVREAANEP